MITVDQWKAIRRVDHLTVPGFSFRRGFYRAHARYRDPGNRPSLKYFDKYVQRFHTVRNNFDKVNALASVIRQTAHFVAVRNKDDRYDKAVNTLHNHALTAMDEICGSAHQQSMENHITRLARPARTITINVLAVTKSSERTWPGLLPAKIREHIKAANDCPAFQKAKLTVVPFNRRITHITNYGGGPILCPDRDGVPAYMKDKFLESSPSSGGRLVGYCNSLQNTHGPKCIDVAYIPDFVDKDTGGLTMRAGVKWGGVAPDRPIVVININPAPALQLRGGLETTLAHELGHAICGCGVHAAAADNLMAGGNERNGRNQANRGQCAWFCSNPWVA